VNETPSAGEDKVSDVEEETPTVADASAEQDGEKTDLVETPNADEPEPAENEKDIPTRGTKTQEEGKEKQTVQTKIPTSDIVNTANDDDSVENATVNDYVFEDETPSTLQQDKKAGSVQQNIRDILLSFLHHVSRISRSTTAAMDPLYDVHIPGCYNSGRWSLAAMKIENRLLHEEASKELLKRSVAQDEHPQPSSLDVAEQPDDDGIPEDERKPKVKSTEKAKRASNKYRTDDKSGGLETRAMVTFGKK
jgi:hypothetical protein